MKIKTGTLVLFFIFLIISLNYFFTVNPVTSFIDGNSLILGIAFLAAAVLFSIAMIILKKVLFKPNLSYQPVMLWVINVLMLIGGAFLVLYHFMETNIGPENEGMDGIKRFSDIFLQCIISFILAAIIYEVYHFIKEYPLRKVFKRIDRADTLVKSGQYKEALLLFEDVLDYVHKNERPKVYAWIKQLRALCHLELSRLEEKRLNLLKATRDFEDILDIKEVREYLGQIKFKLGNIYYEIAEIDYRIEYLNRALGMYEEAMREFSKNEDIESYMVALSNADKVKNEIILQKPG